MTAVYLSWGTSGLLALLPLAGVVAALLGFSFRHAPRRRDPTRRQDRRWEIATIGGVLAF